MGIFPIAMLNYQRYIIYIYIHIKNIHQFEVGWVCPEIDTGASQNPPLNTGISQGISTDLLTVTKRGVPGDFPDQIDVKPGFTNQGVLIMRVPSK